MLSLWGNHESAGGSERRRRRKMSMVTMGVRVLALGKWVGSK